MTSQELDVPVSVKGPGVFPPLDGARLRIAIVHARWNTPIIGALVAGAKSSLLATGVYEQNIDIHSVPGSWELPIACSKICSSYPFPDALIAIGVLIKGETMHFEYIANSVSQGLMKVQLEKNVPIIFGLLTVLNQEQAEIRAGLKNGGHNHGEDWGKTAVELGIMGLK
ncbi:6,7-dimethyl-8-ribityllumazine synthase [Erysiphe necator]|uniref:6,7-dimethyl-8-ribityllumazine synthase n=1 Tax=Uncinula necator TaxID=52586 RepID=A0A0B1PAL3_UNCNE|nr:6,7-dimethyl-8-ribityllumazine synthase [Erysiphe necator]KHJ34011.1 hypothetical protein EV44_g6397 [Erysiphe necator]